MLLDRSSSANKSLLSTRFLLTSALGQALVNFSTLFAISGSSWPWEPSLLLLFCFVYIHLSLSLSLSLWLSAANLFFCFESSHKCQNQKYFFPIFTVFWNFWGSNFSLFWKFFPHFWIQILVCYSCFLSSNLWSRWGWWSWCMRGLSSKHLATCLEPIL